MVFVSKKKEPVSVRQTGSGMGQNKGKLDNHITI
jgi:hypothetical protein